MKLVYGDAETILDFSCDGGYGDGRGHGGYGLGHGSFGDGYGYRYEYPELEEVLDEADLW